MNSAIQLIKEEFNAWDGCELHSITYSSDDECNELFPCVEFSIEQILDEQIKQKDLEEKVKRLNIKLG